MKKIVSILVMSLALSASAQQIGMYGHYFYKPMVYNPAFTGTGDATNVMVISRAQWSGFSGSPQLNIATMDGSLLSKKVGLGATLISDRKGITNRIGGSLSYSYRLNINDDMHLLFGLSLGVMDHQVDYSKAVVELAGDPTMFSGSQNKTVFDGNAGLAVVWKGLEFGAAVPQVIGNSVNYVDTSNVRARYTQERHYMGSLKYKFCINKEKGMSIAPQGLVRFVPNAPFQYDGNVNFEWQDKFWVGATYKSDYAVGANVGVIIHKQLSVGYSYDFIIGDIGDYSGMAHELMLNFKFGKKKEADLPKDDKKLENEGYVKRMDSLETELEISNKKLREMNDKIDKLAKQQAQAPVNNGGNNNQGGSTTTAANTNGNTQTSVNPANSGGNQTQSTENQNAQMGENSANKRVEDGVLIVTSSKTEFKDEDGMKPPRGYYVVIGTYFYRDLAEAEAKRFVAKGYQTTDWVYSGPKNFNYIFMFKCTTKEEAMQKLKVAQNAGVKDAWLQELTD